MDKISLAEMYIAFRRGIEQMIKNNPNATAKDVLDGLELTVDVINLFEKRLSNKIENNKV